VNHVPVQRRLIIPLALWGTHAAATFALVEAHCRRGAIGGELAGISAIRLLLVTATAAAALLVAGNGFTAARAWRSETNRARDPTGACSQVLLTSSVISGIALIYLAWALVFVTEANLCR
jgi:hypothetical protein